MNFNSRKIGIFFILSSGFVLTACGEGSNDKSKAQANVKDDEALYQVYYQKPLFSDGYISESFEITKYSIKNNEINFSKSRNEPLDFQILTENKIFEINTPQSNVIKRVSPTIWTYERLPELEQNLKFELLNLSGENIFDRVLPGYRETIDLSNGLNDRFDQELVKFYQNYKEATFPDGSSCYRLKERQWNQPYITLNFVVDNQSFKQQRENILDTYERLNFHANKADYDLFWGNWHNLDWIFMVNKYDSWGAFGAVGNTNDQTIHAVLASPLLWDVELSLGYERKQLEELKNSNFDFESAFREELLLSQSHRVAMLEKGCFAFNTQAIKAIQKLNKVNWKQGDSSGIGQFFGQRTWIFKPNK
ncbi:hypothetical protein EAH57_08380 [Acinetobacter sp. 2JN-4]|uniref:hypothetical protein n=1 Tax=Acinetobacter sp. 2JN-4 TaxID=2479844 RepID=UPI000EFA03B4|nr:hypothetical protein [Acinetobacter sp. 2JN-4]RLZ09024.1 hypothetical protein EAH57_08380 [Acinetobacter sp. 2JN-4]